MNLVLSRLSSARAAARACGSLDTNEIQRLIIGRELFKNGRLDL